MISVSLLGSTGSIGTQTIEVLRANADRFELIALGGHSNVEAVAKQAWALRPKIVAMSGPSAATAIRDLLPPGTDLVGGPRALSDIAGDADVCVNGVVGFAGLPVTLAALMAGRRLALANKESLITAGPVVRAARATPGAEIVPVDS